MAGKYRISGCDGGGGPDCGKHLLSPDHDLYRHQYPAGIGIEHAHGICRPDLPGPCRFLRHRRLYHGRSFRHLRMSPWLALLCAVAVAVLVALVVGLPTLKLSGYYLGMGTLGFDAIINIVFREWADVTGGASGFVGIPVLEAGPVSFMEGRNYFFLVWLTVLGAIILCRRILASRMGRALRSIHDGENAAPGRGGEHPFSEIADFHVQCGPGGFGRVSLRPFCPVHQPGILWLHGVGEDGGPWWSSAVWPVSGAPSGGLPVDPAARGAPWVCRV